jgi:hypothetical protein
VSPEGSQRNQQIANGRLPGLVHVHHVVPTEKHQGRAPGKYDKDEDRENCQTCMALHALAGASRGVAANRQIPRRGSHK